MTKKVADTPESSSGAKPLWLKALAELLGTALMVFFGCFSAMQTASLDGWAKLIAISAVFAFVVVGLVYTIGSVSGANLNPVTSLAMVLSKRLKWADFGAYAGAQIVGAFLGALLAWGVAPSAVTGTVTSTMVNTDMLRGGAIGALFVGMVLEAIATFFFLYTVLAVTAKKENGPIAGLVIGGALWLAIAVIFYFTGGSLNPARSLGSALVALFNNEWEPIKQIWVYIAGPLIGGLLAAGAYKVTNA